MQITYDLDKNQVNEQKHGFLLTRASALDWPNLMTAVDARKDYLELREIGFGVIEDRLFCVVFTQRGDSMHVISLRKANKREFKNYVDQI